MPIEIVHGGETWQAQTENVGPGGCLVSSRWPLVEHARLRVVGRCQGVESVLNVACSVAWACEQRGGLVFTAGQLGLATRPEAWFKRILEARPGLATGLPRTPERLALETPLYLLPPPRLLVDLAPDEMALLRRAENGITVRDLLSSTGVGEERAARPLFALFEKNVLTLSMGQASEKWKWRAAMAGAGSPCSPAQPASDASERQLRPITPAPTTRAPCVSLAANGAPPLDTNAPRLSPGQLAPLLVRTSAPDLTLLRGVTAKRRSPEAQARLEQARAAVGTARIDQAVVLLREALALAPRDAEISTLLGELAFKDRKR